MTEQAYLEDSSVREFEATVERALDERVVLDRTHFYPTGGGQPHDTGVLVHDGERYRVTDVHKKDTVYHVVDGEEGGPPTESLVDVTVTGRIDWDRRSAHMRYHTAQHLLSALLLEEFDARTVGNQVYADRAHLDCEYDRFDEGDLATIERRMNELVADARSVEWYTLDRAEAERELDTDRTRIDLLPDSITELRIVEIAGEDGPYDRTACAGTHVRNTEAIGEVTVAGRETKGSHAERIEFTLAEE